MPPSRILVPYLNRPPSLLVQGPQRTPPTKTKASLKNQKKKKTKKKKKKTKTKLAGLKTMETSTKKRE